MPRLRSEFILWISTKSVLLKHHQPYKPVSSNSRSRLKWAHASSALIATQCILALINPLQTLPCITVLQLLAHSLNDRPSLRAFASLPVSVSLGLYYCEWHKIRVLYTRTTWPLIYLLGATVFSSKYFPSLLQLASGLFLGSHSNSNTGCRFTSVPNESKCGRDGQ